MNGRRREAIERGAEGAPLIPAREEFYARREQRFNGAVAFKGTDTIPVTPLNIHRFATRIKGIPESVSGHDQEGRRQATKDESIKADELAPAGIQREEQ